ncbi:MAG TPA: helix-turn-helix transcriptional regulator [Candidatus Lumbricidophila sp.]|nr:helix-turn-helix transcriptional regulator [Candidatus Lumbricidophila sp.]
MAVAESLLVLLLNAPAYGLQLHDELQRRTGARRTLNAGQLYRTLDRLERDGLVEAAGTTEQGQALRRLTLGGRVAAEAWLGGKDAAGASAWEETLDRVLLSVATEHHPEVLAEQRSRWNAMIADAEPVQTAPRTPMSLVHSARRLEARAMVSWLDEVSVHGVAVQAAAPRPPRGRPRQRTSSAGASDSLTSSP